jgi:hypothetical protein
MQRPGRRALFWSQLWRVRRVVALAIDRGRAVSCLFACQSNLGIPRDLGISADLYVLLFDQGFVFGWGP